MGQLHFPRAPQQNQSSGCSRALLNWPRVSSWGGTQTSDGHRGTGNETRDRHTGTGNRAFGCRETQLKYFRLNSPQDSGSCFPSVPTTAALKMCTPQIPPVPRRDTGGLQVKGTAWSLQAQLSPCTPEPPQGPAGAHSDPSAIPAAELELSELPQEPEALIRRKFLRAGTPGPELESPPGRAPSEQPLQPSSHFPTPPKSPGSAAVPAPSYKHCWLTSSFSLSQCI